MVGQQITARHKFGRSGRILVSEVVRESALEVTNENCTSYVLTGSAFGSFWPLQDLQEDPEDGMAFVFVLVKNRDEYT